MRRSLRFVSLMVLLFLWIQIQTSCSPRMSGEGSTVLPAIELTQGESSQKYNIQLDFMKHHMSGMLIVRRMPDNEIRIVASTYFGLSLFDFSLRNDQFTVNSCIEPMKKEKVLKLLEMDFRRLFLSGKDIRVKTTKDSATEKEPVERLWKVSGLHHWQYSGRSRTNKNQTSVDSVNDPSGQTI